MLVKDIRPGPPDSAPSNLAGVGATVFFAANDGANGTELWRSDGTAAGTVLVKDINPGPIGSSPALFTRAGGGLFFAASHGLYGQELWRSDGTAGGTALVADIRPGAAGAAPARLTAVGPALFFSADDGVTGRELWAWTAGAAVATGFFAVPACRVVDTRTTQTPLAANTTRTFPVAGACGVPADARAAAVNLIAVNPGEVGNLRLYSTGQFAPQASTINFVAGRTRANNAMVALGTAGQINVQCDMPPGSTATTHFVLDVLGYFR